MQVEKSRKDAESLNTVGKCSTYVTELFAVNGSLNHDWGIHHLCEFHCLWMLSVFFLQNKEE